MAWRAELESSRLRDLVDVKKTFLRLAIHELRRPSRGCVSMLQDGTYGELPEAMREPVR